MALVDTARQSFGSSLLSIRARSPSGPPTASSASLADARIVWRRLSSRSAVFGIACSVWSHPPQPWRLGLMPNLLTKPLEAPVVAVLHAFEIRTHVVRAPRRVARDVRDLVPIRVVRVHEDHRVVRRAAAERAGARVEDAVHLPGVVRLDEFHILTLPRIVLVVTDEEVPSQRLVLGRQRVKRGDVVVFGQGVASGTLRIAALQCSRIAAGLEQQHAEARLGKAGRDGAAAGARTDNDVFGVEVPGCRLTGHRCPETRERTRRRLGSGRLARREPRAERQSSLDEIAAIHG